MGELPPGARPPQLDASPAAAESAARAPSIQAYDRAAYERELVLAREQLRRRAAGAPVEHDRVSTMDAREATDRHKQRELPQTPDSGAAIGGRFPRGLAPFGATAVGVVWAATLDDVSRTPDLTALPDAGRYMRKVEDVARTRCKGDPLAPNVVAVGRAMYRHLDSRLHGAQVPMRAIAKRVGLCVDTVRRCTAMLEVGGLFDRVHTMHRGVIGGVRRAIRGANLYVFRPIRPATGRPAGEQRQDDATAKDEHPPLATVLARCAAVLGLSVGRHGGLEPLYRRSG